MSDSLLHTPLFGIALTLIIFQIASLFYRRFRYTLFNPVILTIIAIIVLLTVTGIPYDDYALGGDMILFLLGPAVVALGVPLFERRREITHRLIPIGGGIIAGATASIISASGIILLMGGNRQLALTMAPKSVTTPIAIGIADKIGAITPLTAAVVVLTGCFGALIGPSFCRLLRINDPASMGLAMGTAAHGIGTGRMLEIDVLGGAIAGLAIGLNGIATALLIPLLQGLLPG